jgi:hypothetical protein
MPFDTSTTVNTSPDIQVYIEGLLVLSPGQDAVKRCDVFVVKHGSDHLLSVDVSLNRPQPNFPFLRLGSTVLQRGLEIQMDTPRGVKKYAPGAGQNVPGAYALSEVIDFQVEHDPRVKIRPAGAHPGVIKLRDGVLYTVARKSTEARLKREGKCVDRAPLGLLIGTSIDFEERKLQLKWGPSAAEEMVLPRPDDPAGSKYIIWINNSRPIPPNPEVNDFKHLYHSLEGVNTGHEFDLEFRSCDDPERGSFRVPCMPAVVGG